MNMRAMKTITATLVPPQLAMWIYLQAQPYVAIHNQPSSADAVQDIPNIPFLKAFLPTSTPPLHPSNPPKPSRHINSNSNSSSSHHVLYLAEHIHEVNANSTPPITPSRTTILNPAARCDWRGVSLLLAALGEGCMNELF
ncbi:hypothetical protein K402DRAFT_396549 [Aulographum hederae CBS 113979]|uniref:Uncharacterized protein n=1 Tax=Aulographum hederae CBS 113979 TaxID=1176131 RepID=A0A6G1GS12_9PEZI|nr:hypothetical protein K402DRAFT_396549 [Aulographum hederae CBS 113979]